jgi:hypothetical protein
MRRSPLLLGVTTGFLLFGLASPASANLAGGLAEVDGPSTATATVYGERLQVIATVPVPASRGGSAQNWRCSYHDFPEGMPASSIDIVPPNAAPAMRLVEGETYAFRCTRADGSTVRWPQTEIEALSASPDWRVGDGSREGSLGGPPEVVATGPSRESHT